MSDSNSSVSTVPPAEPKGSDIGASANPRKQATESRVAEISSLLSALEEAAAESGLTTRPPVPAHQIKHENKLVQVRLGIASSLYTALSHKHAPTAEHSLRVALGCSSWAAHAKLDDETRDALELAALMHDIGKMGLPDSVLSKPNRLSNDEIVRLSQHREIGVDILTNCCTCNRVLEAIRYAGVRFDGQNCHLPMKGTDMPLEARMIAIVDAFDAMTVDRATTPGMPRDKAIRELYEYAGKQFDPEMVQQFVDVLSQPQDALSSQVASRWLSELSTDTTRLPWQFDEKTPSQKPDRAQHVHALFEQKLLDSMYDGVVFVDAQSKILLWSKGTERMTGVSSSAAISRIFAPNLLDMCNEGSQRIPEHVCPVAKCIRTNTQIRQRLFILGRQGEHVAIDLHAIPVQGVDGTIEGATVLLHDAQPEASLQEKCQALHAEVTRDPLTKVANRAEFDRMQALFIETHQQAGHPCSLIMSDIDHFKSINDTYGHQAGDEAIIALANLLSTMCRSGDIVARYGGEEFAILCADCGNDDAASRAEQIRRKLSETPMACLGNKSLTASFGVTELHAGDTCETMLRRADQALLMAKDRGRNQVVQLGGGIEKEQPKTRWWNFGYLRSKPVIETTLTTAVPIDVAIEKLKGFVSDHQARIISTREESVELEVSSESIAHNRRKGDRHLTFRVEMNFGEQHIQRTNNLGMAAGQYAQTRIELVVRPKSSRGRRQADAVDRARLVLQSIKAYLMAKEEGETTQEELATAE